MPLARVAALLTCLTVGACFAPTAERTRRDLVETGVANLGDVHARIEPGVARLLDASGGFVRFRANAPETVLSFTNASDGPRRVAVEVANAFEGSVVSVPAASVGLNTFAFDVDVPAGGEATVQIQPPDPTPVPFRFAWVGDVQGGNERFRDVRARINADPSLEFTIFAGDITNRGTQEEMDAFVTEADQLLRPWFSVLGNHESLMDEPIAFQQTVGRINVRFDYKGARFVLLDSASGTLDPSATSLLKASMEGSGQGPRIVAMHVPPLDPAGLRDGGWNDRSEAGRVLAMLARGGTDLLLTGHIHTLQVTTQAGIPTWVSGNGGVERSAKLDGTGVHYLAVTVDADADSISVEPVMVP